MKRKIVSALLVMSMTASLVPAAEVLIRQMRV